MKQAQNTSTARANESTSPHGRSPEDIQQDIQRTRRQLDGTLDAMQQRLSPDRLMNETIRYLRGSGATEFAHNFNDSVKRNPMPVALMAVSLAWLMWAGRDGQAELDQAGDSRALRDRFEGVGDDVREQAARIRQGASHGAEQLSDGFTSLLRDQPLLLGALGVAAGAALGALLPTTQSEDALLGEAGEQLGEATKRQLHLRRGKRAAQAASEAAKDELRDDRPQSYQHGRIDGLDSENPSPGL